MSIILGIVKSRTNRFLWINCSSAGTVMRASWVMSGKILDPQVYLWDIVRYSNNVQSDVKDFKWNSLSGISNVFKTRHSERIDLVIYKYYLSSIMATITINTIMRDENIPRTSKTLFLTIIENSTFFEIRRLYEEIIRGSIPNDCCKKSARSQISISEVTWLDYVILWKKIQIAYKIRFSTPFLQRQKGGWINK